MKKEQIEFFHGNKQEIENEKQKKRELMSYFPKTLGTIDETKYVLWDENKPSLVNPLENKEQENFKSTGLSTSNKENKQVPTTFENSAENSTLLKPEKEKNETFAPKSAFDFNLTEVTNTPFSTHALHKEPKMNYGNKNHTTDVESDSLGLAKGALEDFTDSLKTKNVNYNSTNLATPNKEPGLYGKRPQKDYTEDLNKLKQELPPIALSILNNSGTKITVFDNLHSIDKEGNIIPRIGRYYANKNKIYLDSKKVDRYTFISEVIHAVQNYLKMTDSGNSNLEFQEHVIKDLYFRKLLKRYKDIKYSKALFTSNNENYSKFIDNIFDDNQILDLNKFLDSIGLFFEDFQRNHSSVGAYQKRKVDNYNYNWEKILKIFGVEYKY